MDDNSLQIPPEKIFDRIKVLAETRHYVSALALLDIVEEYREKKEWKYPTAGLLLSYRGLCTARGKKLRSQGLEMCRRAVDMEFFHPDCFLNLGRVYLDLKRRREAHAAFQKGLALDPSFAPIKSEVEKMGRRRQAPLSFLPRRHFLNRFLGSLFSRPVK